MPTTLLRGGAQPEFFELGILELKTTRFWVRRDQCGVRNPPRGTSGASKAQGGTSTGGELDGELVFAQFWALERGHSGAHACARLRQD